MSDFTDRAPPEVVQRERDRLTELEAKLTAVRRDLQRLRKVRNEKPTENAKTD